MVQEMGGELGGGERGGFVCLVKAGKFNRRRESWKKLSDRKDWLKSLSLKISRTPHSMGKGGSTGKHLLAKLQ